MDGWMDGRTDGWMDERFGGCVGAWMKLELQQQIAGVFNCISVFLIAQQDCAMAAIGGPCKRRS